jgi:hypothetical protein
MGFGLAEAEGPPIGSTEEVLADGRAGAPRPPMTSAEDELPPISKGDELLAAGGAAIAMAFGAASRTHVQHHAKNKLAMHDRLHRSSC